MGGGVKAAVIYRTGQPDVFSFEDVPDPPVGAGDVLVDVEAISIEGADTLNRAQAVLERTPHIVGYQCAGTIVATGPDVTGLSTGDRVVTVGLDGSHAERRAAPELFCWSVPDALSLEEAACVPIPFGTADDCLFEFGKVQPGQTVLVQAGASGVGVAAIQLAKRAGARVLATASSDERLGRLRDLGLDDGINYAKVDFVEEVRRLTEGRGADLVIDSVGGETLSGSLRSLAYRGRCISVGDAGRGTTPVIDISGMRGGNHTLIGYFLGAELLLSPRAHARIASLLDDVATGALRVVVDRRYPLREAAEAHAYMESRQAFGRVLLIP
jgi:NADPH:quinone reductase